MSACKHGHVMTPANTGIYLHTRSGKATSFCRACRARYQRLRYRNDDAFRKAECAKRRARYHKKKERLHG